MSIYPLHAIVGQGSLVQALLTNAIDPGVGGLLIRGQRGTAKSTAARGLAALLPPLHVVEGCPYHCDPHNIWAGCPHCAGRADLQPAVMPAPFIDLPLGATEDRVLGTLDFEEALREGRRAFQPGLLAAAHRGILYIDEVNLLPDHLVDVLLDAAAMGVNTVQREGVAFSHPARFILIGTMNPEEGDLRPQLLDRFGLMVEVSTPTDLDARKEAVRRRLAFEADPQGFSARFATEEAALAARLMGARTQLEAVGTPDAIFDLIARVCAEFQVDGLRADLAMHRAARALAAWAGRDHVAAEDVRQAAEWVLPHRRRRQPFEEPGLDRDKLDDLLKDPEAGSGAAPGAPGEGSQPQAPGPSDGQGAEAAGQAPAAPPGKVFAAAATPDLPRLSLKPAAQRQRQASGRRSTVVSRRGRYTRAHPAERITDLAIDATLRAAAINGQDAHGHPRITRADLRQKVRQGRAGTLILFVVDSSGSMAARKRMEAVKGAALGLLMDAYQRRDRVGVITFSGAQAQMLLPPTNSIDRAQRALRDLPTGGRTPLPHALLLATEALARAYRAQPDLLSLTVILSDGKPNVPLPGGGPRSILNSAWNQTLETAQLLARLQSPILLLDTELAHVRLRKAQHIAEAMGAEYLPLDDLSAVNLMRLVDARLGRGRGA